SCSSGVARWRECIRRSQIAYAPRRRHGAQPSWAALAGSHRRVTAGVTHDCFGREQSSWSESGELGLDSSAGPWLRGGSIGAARSGSWMPVVGRVGPCERKRRASGIVFCSRLQYDATMPTITCKVSPELDARLSAASRARRTTKSVVVREILEAQLSAR